MTIKTFVGVAVLAGAALAQTPPTLPSFEVASVKPAPPPSDNMIMVRMGGDDGRVDYNNVTLKNVLTTAYKVKPFQVTGPSWLDSERYDIVAKPPDGAPKEQIPQMLQGLLAERFQMKVHRETKELPVYTLVVGKDGPKLQKADDSKPFATSMPGGPPPPPPPPSAQSKGGPSHGTSDVDVQAKPGAGGRGAAGGGGGGAGGMRMMMSVDGPNGVARMEARTTMAGLTSWLSNVLDRPVLDETKIDGAYDIKLEIAAEDLGGIKQHMAMASAGMMAGSAPSPAPDAAPAASIFTAIQQLGLKLEARKAPIEFLIVDSASKVPTEN